MRITPVVRNVILLNVLVFFLPQLLGIGPNNMADLFGLRYVMAERFSPEQFLTHMFLHADLGHLFFNMLGVYVFGSLVEMGMGGQRFLIFYFVCGLGAAFLYSGVNFYENYTMGEDTKAYVRDPTPEHFDRYVRKYEEINIGLNPEFVDTYYDNPNNVELRRESVRYVNSKYRQKRDIPMIGASGAVFGILMAAALMFPNVQLFLLFPPIPVKIKYIVALYGVSAIFGAIHAAPGDNVAHYAHLGGMVFGWITVAYWGLRNIN